MELYLLRISDKLTFSEKADEYCATLRIEPCACIKQNILDSSLSFSPSVQFSKTKLTDGQSLIYFTNSNFKEITFSGEFYIKKQISDSEAEINKQFAFTGYRYLKVNSYTDISFFSNIPHLESNQQSMKFVEFANRFVHLFLKFKASDNDQLESLQEVLKNRCGTSKDFSHFLIAILRFNKIQCRLCTGYILVGKKELTLNDIHAWVEVFLPQRGWVGFDPTNLKATTTNYIKIMHGEDYSDCVPVKILNRHLNSKNSSSSEYLKRLQQIQSQQ